MTITHPWVLTSVIAMVIGEMSKTVYVEVIGFFPAISCKMIVKTIMMLIDFTYNDYYMSSSIANCHCDGYRWKADDGMSRSGWKPRIKQNLSLYGLKRY